MRVFYATQYHVAKPPLRPGALMIVLEPEEAELQELVVQGFLPIVEGHDKAQLQEILQYVCVSHDECQS